MDKPRFIVPPGVEGRGVQTKSATTAEVLPVEAIKTRSVFMQWVAKNKSLTTALCVALVFVGLLGFVLVADRPVNLLGLQLNPMYNQASLQMPCDDSSCPEVPPAPTPTPPGGNTGGGTTGGTLTGTAPTGFQVSVRDISCSEQQATSPVAGPNGSSYTTDTNYKDPDCARINFITPNVGSVDTNMGIYANDFRIGTRLAESESGCTNQIDSQIMWTPWASDGGGTSQQARGQSSSNDPDCVWIHYETRPMPTGKAIRDARVGIASGSSVRYTAWARQGGGQSAYSAGSGLRPTTVTLEAQAFDVAQLSMTGNFADSTVGQPYSTNLSLIGNPSTPCSWSLVSINPSILGASIQPDSTNSGASAVFRATPGSGGSYQIVIRANCLNGQSTEGTFTWNVNGGTSTDLDIVGDFPDGTAKQAYSHNLSLNGSATQPCYWHLVSIAPFIDNAQINEGIVTGGTAAVFAATADAANLYQVTVRVDCQNGQNVQETFPWRVNSGEGALAITGTMANGVVNQEYTHTFGVTGNSSDSCAWTLESVNPAATGATLGSSNGRFVARPTVAGTYRVSVAVLCGMQRATGSYDWVVTSTGNPTTTTNRDTCLDPNQTNSLVAIYRFWSPSAGDHLYTTNSNEKPSGYRQEGIAGYVYSKQMPNTTPIYRSAQTQIGSHYYTTSNEDPSGYGYVDEGILGYAYNQSVAGSSAWYRLHKGGEISDYVHTINEQERVAVKELGYEEQGQVAYICGGSQPTQLQPIFRLWSNSDTNHFYTTNFSERDSALTRGYISEGIAGYIFGVRKDGSTPLYRSYSNTLKDHFYTTNELEARTAGYNLEGIMGYLSGTEGSGTTAFYRLFKGSIGDHFYTVSDSEAQAAANSGYIREGTVGHLYTESR